MRRGRHLATSGGAVVVDGQPYLALAVIEDAATRTLTELRAIRDGTSCLGLDSDARDVVGDGVVEFTHPRHRPSQGPRTRTAGYGLVGMRERATLLGGTFHAGPAAERGWRVEAVLPRTGTPR